MNELVPLYELMAADGLNFRGLSLLTQRKPIGALIRKHRATRLLDWGAGAGDAYRRPHLLHEKWGIPMPIRYDPAFPKYARRPTGQFEGVICSDVLEHIPERDIDAVIDELFSFATKFVFASVCCRPAKKTFPDGTNLHVCVQPMMWWVERFSNRKPGIEIQLAETP